MMSTKGGNFIHLELWGVNRKSIPTANSPPIDVFPAYDEQPGPGGAGAFEHRSAEPHEAQPPGDPHEAPGLAVDRSLCPGPVGIGRAEALLEREDHRR